MTDIFEQLKDPRQFIELFNSLDFANYCANRDRGMTHENYMSLFDWPEEKKQQFKTMYEG